MQTKPKMLAAINASLCTMLALAFAAHLHAGDSKSSPLGSWTCTGTGPNGDALVGAYFGAVDGELWGTLSERTTLGDPYATTFDHGRIQGDNISFTMVSKYSKVKITSRYKGKVTGDTISGKVEISRDGGTSAHDWTGKRDIKKKC